MTKITKEQAIAGCNALMLWLRNQEGKGELDNGMYSAECIGVLLDLVKSPSISGGPETTTQGELNHE
jgi:hypothetical protein